METEGYLELILGPMFSGKTSMLIDLYKKYSFCNVKIVCINHIDDNRYNSEEIMVNHDALQVPCEMYKNMREAIEKYAELLKSNTKVVFLINEGQFFDDLYDCVNEIVNTYNKKVYVCGLDGDYKRKRFGALLDLIPICDSVCKLKALCAMCKDGTPALFSHRTIDNTGCQKQIGTIDTYVPVCRKCYNKINKL